MSQVFGKLSTRERTLAYITIILVLAFLVYVLVTVLMNNLYRLDMAIEEAESEILRLQQEVAQLDVINRAYQAVIEQHSSEWTQAEIHDRLRTELLRLALVNMPPPGALPDSSQKDYLVEIPTWPAGSLDEREKGYREYQIRVSTKPTTISNVALFLRRIHESPQLLRVDRLELVKPNPESAEVLVNMTVTRTIIGETTGAEKQTRLGQGELNLASNPSFEEYDLSQHIFPDWSLVQAEGVQSDLGVTDGQYNARIVAKDKNSRFYQERELRPNTVYRLELDICVHGDASLAIMNAHANRPIGEIVSLINDGIMRRYSIIFRTENSSDTVFNVPEITLLSPDTEVFMDNVRLIEGAL